MLLKIVTFFEAGWRCVDCSEGFCLGVFDDNLRSGIKGKTEAEVDILLDKAVTFIRYIGT